MNNQNLSEMKNEATLNRNLAAVCGIFCGSCGVFIATQENDTYKLQNYALALNQSFEETLCDGCLALRKSAHCAKICTFISCASSKDIEFCGQCNDYPCTDLKAFQSKMPHRIEMWESQKQIREVGWEKWLIEMNKHFSCPGCNAINSAYNIVCRKCGTNPGSGFAKRHKDAIFNYLTSK